MSDFPGARVRNAQDFWRYLDEYREGGTRAVAERLDPRTLEQLEHAAKTAWLPIELDARFVDAVVDEFADDPSDVWRKYTSRFVSGGLMKAVFDGTVRIFGLSLHSIVKAAPRAWQQSYRGCGTMAVHRQEGVDAVVLEVNDLHPMMLQRDGYLMLLRGMFLGLHDLASVEDQMDFAVDRESNQLTAVFRW